MPAVSQFSHQAAVGRRVTVTPRGGDGKAKHDDIQLRWIQPVTSEMLSGCAGYCGGAGYGGGAECGGSAEYLL